MTACKIIEAMSKSAKYNIFSAYMDKSAIYLI